MKYANSGATPVLVTGGKGMLGSGFIAAGTHFRGLSVYAVGRDDLDACDERSLDKWADKVEGGWIIHCASMVDVEGCARNPDAARSTIVDGARNVARLAKRAGARLFYPQSFLIYDGAATLISEDQVPRPLSVYGQLKYEAEQVINELLDNALVVRMAGFFGGNERDKNFVGRIIPVIRNAVARHERALKVGDRVWQPTWTFDLAFNSLHLISVGASGVYQMGSLGEAAFYEVAREVVNALGWGDQIEIEPVTEAEVSSSELGRRPRRAVLSCDRLTRENRNLQRQWRATLHAYLGDPFFKRFGSTN